MGGTPVYRLKAGGQHVRTQVPHPPSPMGFPVPSRPSSLRGKPDIWKESRKGAQKNIRPREASRGRANVRTIEIAF